MARVKNNQAAVMAGGAKAIRQELVATAKPVGRPSLRTPEVESELFIRLADGEDLVSICESPDMPGRSTVCSWMENDPEFRAKMQTAWQAQTLFMIGMGFSVVNGGEHSTGSIERDKAKLSYIRWLMGKFDRQWFGEHIQITERQETVQIVLPSEFDGIEGDFSVVSKPDQQEISQGPCGIADGEKR